jgi:hypothetical protein
MDLARITQANWRGPFSFHSSGAHLDQFEASLVAQLIGASPVVVLGEGVWVGLAILILLRLPAIHNFEKELTSGVKLKAGAI